MKKPLTTLAVTVLSLALMPLANARPNYKNITVKGKLSYLLVPQNYHANSYQKPRLINAGYCRITGRAIYTYATVNRNRSANVRHQSSNHHRTVSNNRSSNNRSNSRNY